MLGTTQAELASAVGMGVGHKKKLGELIAAAGKGPAAGNAEPDALKATAPYI